MTALDSLTPQRQLARTTSIRALARLEARRYVRRLALWIGLAGTVAFTLRSGANVGDSWSGQTYENAVPLSFLPLIIGTFIAALQIGGTDRSANPAGPAEGTPLGAEQRNLARLAGLVVPIALSILVIIGIAIASRVEGGFWIGEAPRRTDSALHSFVELMQPPLLVAVAGASGVALGRTRRRLAPAMIVGSVFWFLAGGFYWVWNIAGLHSVALAQVQPMRIDLPSTTDPLLLPADWFVSRPNEYDGWQRIWVHLPTVVWHNVYLLGLALVCSGMAIREARGARLALGGLGVTVVGVVAQLLVSPF